MNETIKHILDNNPGLLNILLTGVLLPMGVLWLTNRHNRKLKDLEKRLELKFKSKDEIRDQEKKVYSSLSKILFDVQQLHISLSLNCVGENCIADALKRFDSSISKCHDEIANNMLYLSSDAINLIYGFFNSIGQLKIQLQELDRQKEYEMSNVTVYYAAQKFADAVIEIQELFISERSDLKVQFDKSKQQRMKYCCGQEPTKELKDKYQKLMAIKQIPNTKK
jgi:alpha-amylase/alpha-mannosidase (GH57 family)